MITVNKILNAKNAKNKGDASFENMLFSIAGTIGIATKNGYDYAFPEWSNQHLFENQLPVIDKELPNYNMPQTYGGYHFGFTGFDVPDNVSLYGEFGSEKYFDHCKDLIRHYFKLKPVCDKIDDAIIIHYRDYVGGGYTNWYDLDETYYHKALEQFPPNKRIVVISDNIEAAKKAIKLDCEYQTNLPIEDFYILSNAKYLIMANSTFSWWGSWLSQAKTVAPYNWFKDVIANEYVHTDLYCKDWIII